MSKGGFWDAAGRASVMGLHLVSGIIVGGVLGYALDTWLGTKPWGLLFFLFVGVVAGFRNMWRDARKLMRFAAEPEHARKEQRGEGKKSADEARKAAVLASDRTRMPETEETIPDAGKQEKHD